MVADFIPDEQMVITWIQKLMAKLFSTLIFILGSLPAFSLNREWFRSEEE